MDLPFLYLIEIRLILIKICKNVQVQVNFQSICVVLISILCTVRHN